MALRTGTQRSATYIPDQYMPGDVVGGRTSINLGTNGYFANGDLVVGYGCFLMPSGNQVNVDRSVAGATSPVAGIVLRNQGMATIPFAETLNGFSMSVADGMQVTVGNTGDFAVVLTGVDAAGVADHLPTVGENIFVNETTGELACSSLDVVAGYALSRFKITRVGLISASVTLAAFQLGCVVSSVV